MLPRVVSFVLFVLLVAAPASARPPHKQSLKKHYGRFLSESLFDCTTCHVPREEAEYPEYYDDAPPHNEFGARLSELADELAEQNRPHTLIDRLVFVADEDSDGDTVPNELEILIGRAPGRAEEPLSSDEWQAAEERRSQWRQEHGAYPWRPFQPVVRPELPVVAHADWSRHPIDAFVAQEHERHGVVPRPPAERHVLLRRVYLDLIGLPPTRQQLHEFLADESPGAYERVVDRLLASPQYGERWGRHWMDVWRYSDWAGWGDQVRDSKPHIWRWRDWIIESLNDDVGYDQIVTEMLAADELKPADTDAMRATGFLVRNYKLLSREKWMQDTVQHTIQAFQGITIGCARCHDHKYDLITQDEYYQIRAIFEPHNVRTDRLPGEPDTAKDGLVRAFDAEPEIATYVYERGDDRQPLTDNVVAPGVPEILSAAEYHVEPVELPPTVFYPGLNDYIREETLATAEAKADQAETQRDNARQALTKIQARIDDLAARQHEPDTAFLADSFTTPRPEVWQQDGGEWQYVDGHLRQNQTKAEQARLLSVSPHPQDFTALLRFSIGEAGGWRSVGMSFDVTDGPNAQSLYLSAHSGGPKIQISHCRNGETSYPADGKKDYAVAANREYVVQLDVQGPLVNVSVDGDLLLVYHLPEDRRSGRFAIWTFDAEADLYEARVEPLADDVALVEKLPDELTTPAVLHLATAERARQRAEGVLAGAEKTVAAARANVTSLEARLAADRAKYLTPDATQEDVEELSRAAARAERQAAALRAEEELLAVEQQLVELQRIKQPDDEAVKTATKQVEDARQKCSAAHAAVDEVTTEYSPLGTVYPKTSTGRRAALARWMVDRKNPLAARVAVNHIWQRHFGTGLVTTMFDFGQNGADPSHPALLDYLAAELMEPSAQIPSASEGSAEAEETFHSGDGRPAPWSMKHLHRLIVTSNTYRMASTPDENNARIDPDNRYLWRFPVRRMEAECVRDSVLYVTGQLDETFGGPDIDHTKGFASRRRSLYFRHAGEKQMQFLKLFDAASVNECYRRKESIVPQQALALANSELALNNARLLARRLAADHETPDEFLTAAFEVVLSRPATIEELATCRDFLREREDFYAANSDSFAATATDDPNNVEQPSGDPALRARENLVHVLLNHNDFVMIR